MGIEAKRVDIEEGNPFSCTVSRDCIKTICRVTGRRNEQYEAVLFEDVWVEEKLLDGLHHVNSCWLAMEVYLCCTNMLNRVTVDIRVQFHQVFAGLTCSGSPQAVVGEEEVDAQIFLHNICLVDDCKASNAR